MSSIDNDFFVFKFTQNGLRVYEKHELKIFLKKFEKRLDGKAEKAHIELAKREWPSRQGP